MDRTQVLNSFRKRPVSGKTDFITNYCKGKRVLDIGCIGQDNNPDRPEWLHGKIRQVATLLAGVDINTEKMEQLREQGYLLFSAITFSDKDFKDPDIVVMADVIEHVSDIVAFLKHYKKLASDRTVFLISTPNPYSIRQSFSILLFGRPGINPEHTVAIDPTNMMELLDRAGFELIDFSWLHEYDRPKKSYNKVLFQIYRLMYSVRKFWAPNYIVAVKPNKPG
ncbi:MAG: methyltransferase domain-containing protein [Bacteroidales bacterium]|nr:methyltransferase domain-containing protein [Bacteroidales bacterium]